MKFDDFLGIIGEFGPYQRRVYFLLLLPVLFVAIQIMAPIFILAVPDHRCKIAGLPNDTYAVQSDAHLQLVDRYIPRKDVDGVSKYSQCTVYAFRVGNATDDVYVVADSGNGTADSVEQSCQEWVYDLSQFTSTAAAEANMVCDRLIYKAHAVMAYSIGGLLGFLSIGTISDRLGRRKAYFIGLTILAVFSTLMVWLPNIYVFLAIRFITGFGFGGFYNGAFVYVMEYIGPSRRMVLGILINVFWSTGMFLHTLLAWLIRDWRHLQLATSLPFFCFIVYYWIISESPRWLLAKGRMEEGLDVLHKMAKVNKVEIDENAFEIDKDLTESDKEGTIFDLFRTGKLALLTLIVFFNWAVIAMQYYGLTLNISNLGGNLYLNYLYTSLVECGAYILCIPGLYCTGRKVFHCICMLVGGVAMLLAIFPQYFHGAGMLSVCSLAMLLAIFPQYFQGAASAGSILALSLIGKFGSSAAFATIYLFSVELFPTVLRNSAMGASAMFASLGTVICPYIVELSNIVNGPIAGAIPLIIFGVLSIAAGLLALYLPETKNRRLPDNLHDMRHLADPMNETWKDSVHDNRRRSLLHGEKQ